MMRANYENEITNSKDCLDSRDIIGRIEYLREQENLDRDEVAELAALVALDSEGRDYSGDWEFGATLIRDSYFEDYAQEFAGEIGAIDPRATWPTRCIDWEQAARELKMDYSGVNFDGVTYWVR